MLRKLINWLLYLLRIKKKETKKVIIDIMELLSLAFVTMSIVYALNQLGPFPKPPWYIRLWRSLKWHSRIARAILIGY